MYHWYLLLRRKLNSSAPTNNEQKLIHGNDPIGDSYLRESRAKLFWIGLCELLPIAGGVVLFENYSAFFFPFDYVIIGIIVSVAIAYMFSKEVPDQPIGIHSAG